MKQEMLVLKRGENVIETITQFCKDKTISSASFTAIGAVERVQIGYYDLAKREYFFTKFDEIFEVASMIGNIAMVYPEGTRGVDGSPFVHTHAVLSRCDETCSTVGGHIKEAFVAVTLEIAMHVHDFPLERKLDESVGLKLLCGR